GLQHATPENLRDAFLHLDKILLSDWKTQHTGSTGIVALIEEIEEPQEFLVMGREVLSSPSSSSLFDALEPQDRVGVARPSPQLTRLGGSEKPAFLITIANVGDSRGTLFHSDGGFSILSRDHKPTNKEELERIKRAGGFVTVSPSSVPRVDGILALSRAFGDGLFKDNRELGPTEQRVVAVPDVHTFFAFPGDVLMLACDGVYEPEAMNWVFVSHFMMTLLFELQNDLTEASVKLLEQAYQSFSGDNISVLLTRFEKGENKERLFRRFEVTPEGHVVSEGGASGDFAASAGEQSSIDAFKGPLLQAGSEPITL
ncbi:hypothetical protein, conserved, partial [Eimeria acervulina]